MQGMPQGNGGVTAICFKLIEVVSIDCPRVKSLLGTPTRLLRSIEDRIGGGAKQPRQRRTPSCAGASAQRKVPLVTMLAQTARPLI
jgi:hypothetical protein